MATKAANKRLTKEYLALQAAPPPFILARPLESNVLEWHYVIRGPPDSPYAGGEYHGKLIFPGEYPFKPPAIKMLTPSGRFQIDFRLCLSMSDYHPNTWNPAWSISTILTGLLSFMLEETPTTGSINTTVAEKKALAAVSHAWNLKNPKFREVFPELSTPELVPLEKCMPGSLEKGLQKTEATAEPPKSAEKPLLENGAPRPEPNGHAQPAPIADAGAAPANAPPVAAQRPLQQQQQQLQMQGSSWTSFLLFFLIGLAGLITARIVFRVVDEL